MKCDICGNKIQEQYLKKIIGTVVKNEKGKKKNVCPDCQRKYDNDKKKMLEKL